MISYEKIDLDHPAYERVKAAQRDGVYVCDALNHNDPSGCDNPACGKYVPSKIHPAMKANSAMKAIEIYNKLFAENKLNFSDFEISELPESTRRYLETIVLDLGYSVSLHNPVIDDEYLFRINHPIMKYLLHNPNYPSHIWADTDFNNVENNQALVLLFVPLDDLPEDDIKKLCDHIKKLKGV